MDNLSIFFKKRATAVTIIVGNQKGGVGKTTNSYLLAYTFAKKDIKTLVVDLDPQANVTKTLMLTRELHRPKQAIKKTLMAGLQDRELNGLQIDIMDNLDLLPSYTDFNDFTKYLYKNTKTDKQEDYYLKPFFDNFKKEYDIIIIDVPPFSIEITKNAVVMSDYVLISLQTQEDSLSGAEEYIKTLVTLKQKYDLPIEVLGFIPMLTEKRNTVDKLILSSANESFGEDNIFKTIIPSMARIKRFPISGITEIDRYDKAVLEKYDSLSLEVLNKIIEFESEE